MPINEPTIVEIQPIDLISGSRSVINDNFNEATELGSETRAGLVQLATNPEVLAEVNDVVMTPEKTGFLLSCSKKLKVSRLTEKEGVAVSPNTKESKCSIINLHLLYIDLWHSSAMIKSKLPNGISS